MKWHIDSRTTISELQEQFRQRFPHLKLEFFFNGREGLSLSSSFARTFPNARIVDLCPGCHSTQYIVPENCTIGEWERALSTHFALPARVYLLKDGYWLRSKRHDDLPLHGTEFAGEKAI